MPHFVVLTRLSPRSIADSETLTDLARRITEAVRKNIPDARWIESYGLIGRYDFLDIFELRGLDTARLLEMTIRAAAKADVEVLPVTAGVRTEQNLLGPESRFTFGDEVEQASRDSFPASDAPAWTGATA